MTYQEWPGFCSRWHLYPAHNQMLPVRQHDVWILGVRDRPVGSYALWWSTNQECSTLPRKSQCMTGGGSVEAQSSFDGTDYSLEVHVILLAEWIRSVVVGSTKSHPPIRQYQFSDVGSHFTKIYKPWLPSTSFGPPVERFTGFWQLMHV